MTAFVYEFLYRGSIKSEKRDAGWHVVLGDEQEQFGKINVIISEPLPPAIAKKQGFDLPSIIKEINSELLNQCDALKQENASLKSQLHELQLSAENAVN